MKTVNPVPLKFSYYFIPITENDFNLIAGLLTTFNRNPSKHADLIVSDLPDTLIISDFTIKYSNIIALGTTDYNKKICERVLDSHQFNSKYRGGYTYEPTTAWQCFGGFKPVNDVPYWKLAKNGITHPDASCSWKCLLSVTSNPTHGILIQTQN